MTAGRRAQAEHRLTVTLRGDHVDVLDAVALAEECTAAEAAAELLAGALDLARRDSEVQQLLRARRRRQRRHGLQVVGSATRSPDPGPLDRTVPTSASSTKREVVAIEAVASFDPNALRRLRQAKGLSHDGLAERVGIARPNLIAYEKGGKRPSPRTLRALAAALGTDPMKLLSVTARDATLADLRAAKAGLTTTETAAALEMPRHSYDRIEAGRRPLDAQTAGRLAELLGVSPSTVVAAHRRGSGPRP
ncbi:MAG: helix-turn-helix domain-containing protein [Acidimicrobiia bacterium]